MNGYLSFEERINMKGEEIKETISNIIQVPKIKKDTTLVSGTFDLVFELEVKEEVLESRQTLEKKKGGHKDNTEIEQYYGDFGNEVTKEQAYRKIVNDGSVEEGCAELCNKI